MSEQNAQAAGVRLIRVPRFKVVSLHLCRDVSRHTETNELWVGGIVTQMQVQDVPAVIPAMWYFAEITGHSGRFSSTFRIRHSRSSVGKFVAEWNHDLSEPDCIYQIFGTTRDIPIDTTGCYEFELVANNIVVAKRHFNVVQIGSDDDLGNMP